LPPPSSAPIRGVKSRVNAIVPPHAFVKRMPSSCGKVASRLFRSFSIAGA